MRARFIGLTALFVAFFPAFAAPALAAEPFEGSYRIAGVMPNNAAYEGVAEIKAAGDVFVVVWKVDDAVYFGSGLRSGDVLSIVFMPINAQARPGIASLRIKGDHVTEGSWSVIGAPVVAHEQWTPQPKGEAL